MPPVIKVLVVIVEKVVVSIGGSILIPDDRDSVFIKELASVLKELSVNVNMVIVCGGGKIARYYTNTGKELGGTTEQRDILGIGATRLNAELLRIALGNDAFDGIPENAKDAAAAFGKGKIVVMGGTSPGHTTDAVAAEVAGLIGCRRIINATSVDAVYSDDPKKDRNAERFAELTIEELSKIVYDEHDAGRSSVFDPVGVKIAMRDRINILVVNGRDLDEMRNAILGNKIKGTVIRS
ncbi:MAG: UMP kinase [Methanomassiliicoccaceae archaeon]|nr:UMP kinase [Methanomassiliicoccaceae archaeon]